MHILCPFKSSATTEKLAISADLRQHSPFLLLSEFIIEGNTDAILWPSAASSERSDELWKHTCLEIFFSKGDSASDSYTEINCSPAGPWNAYSFSKYREGMTLHPDITVRLKHSALKSTSASFAVEIQSSSPLEARYVGLTAVIEFKNGDITYWSLRHPQSAPNFHDKAGWIPSATR